MAVKKKTVDEIAKEYAIDMSDEAAKKVADAYIRPTLDEINEAEQKVITDTQAARKTLDNNYFNQYRANTYEAQSRGLTGGLAQMDNQQLRMQLGQKNADLSKNLIQAQFDAATKRGSALTDAEAYKTNYLNKIRAQVAELQQADYNQRYQAYIDNENLLLKKQQLQEEADRWEKEYELNKQQFELDKTQYENNNKSQSIQNQAYADEYARTNLPDIYNTYSNMIKQGNTSGAENYLSAQIAKLANLGYDTSSIRTDIQNLETIRQYQEYIDTYQSQASKAKWSGRLSKLGWGALTGLLGASGIGLPAAIAAGATGAVSTSIGYDAANQLEAYLEQARNARNKATLPSWYTGTTDSWYTNYLKAIGALE